jgi:hypothetical protein
MRPKYEADYRIFRMLAGQAEDRRGKFMVSHPHFVFESELWHLAISLFSNRRRTS